MVKKILISLTFMLLTLMPFDTYAEVLNGTATLGSGVIWNGSSYGFTPNVNLSYDSENVYRYSSDLDNPFIMGSRYITGLNLGSTGANTFSGVVEIPVGIYNLDTVSVYNRPTSSAFHLSLGGFYDWGTLDVNVTDFTSNCGVYYNIDTSSPYNICVYRVSFTAKSNTMIYGRTNLSWALYDWSNANNLVFQPLGHAWGNNGGGWIFPKQPNNIEGAKNIAPYYVLSYGNNVSETLLQQQIEQNQQIINQNQTIINQQNQNTNSIINNQDSNTQDIIDNQNQNTQDIIDNQNSNTDKEIESQKVCEILNESQLNWTKGYVLASNGQLSQQNDNYSYTSDFYNVDELIIQQVSSSARAYTCFYDKDFNILSCKALNTFSIGSFTLPNNTFYVRFSQYNTSFKFQINTCKNGNQALNDSVNNLNDNITSEDTPNTNQDIEDMNDMVASDTPISDLITMPLTLINAYINGINSTCSPINLGNLYGTDLILPCINLEERLDSNLWSMIDIFFCIFMCYNIGMLFVTAFDGITSLRDDFEGLYQPRHADVGYQPRHGGGN